MVFKKQRFYYWIRKIHLYLGLGLGILFFIICISGAILTWKPEINSILYKESVVNEHKNYVAISKIKSNLKKDFPQGDFRTILFRDSTLSVKILLFVPGTYYYAFMNPYTGELIHLQDMKQGWINILVPLHRNLLLGDIGESIVHWSTLLFFVMMMTGIFLWWPKNTIDRSKAFTIQWRWHPIKLNYDFHKVMGFYVSWITLWTVATGLFWGFDIVRESLYWMTQENRISYDQPVLLDAEIGELSRVEEIMEDVAMQMRPILNGKYLNISYPHKDSEAIHATVISPSATVYNLDHFYFNPYTGKQMEGRFENGRAEEASLYKKLNGMVYDIHLGNLLGWPSRLLVFLATLIMASMPISGFFIYWHKKRINNRRIQ